MACTTTGGRSRTVAPERKETAIVRPESTSVVETLPLSGNQALRRRFMVLDEPMAGNFRFGLALELLDKLADGVRRRTTRMRAISPRTAAGAIISSGRDRGRAWWSSINAPAPDSCPPGLMSGAGVSRRGRTPPVSSRVSHDRRSKSAPLTVGMRTVTAGDLFRTEEHARFETRERRCDDPPVREARPFRMLRTRRQP